MWQCSEENYSHPRINNCTIAHNVAESSGGGLWSQFGCDLTIQNSIIWANTATNDTKDNEIGIGLVYDACNPECTVSYSNVRGGLDGIEIYYYVNWEFGNVDADPCFADPGLGDYHLLGDSPCIDAGDPSYVPMPDERDIDTEPRAMSGCVDIGADEFTSTLTPILGISAKEFHFHANEAGSDPQAQVLSVYNATPGTLIGWEIRTNCDWLQVAPDNGLSSGETTEVTLRPDIRGMSRGVYACQLTVSSKDALQSPQAVGVTLTLHGPRIELSVSELSFYGIKGEPNPPAQSFAIRNRGSASLAWSASYDCTWLSVDPVYGTTIDETDQVKVSVDTSMIFAGTHSCDVLVSDPCAENSPQVLSVTLCLADDDGVLQVPLEYPNIQAAISAAESGQTVVIGPGTHSGDGNRDLDFGGRAITVRSIAPDDPATVASTVIDCRGTISEPHRGFYFHKFEKAGSVLAGLTIVNGYAERGGGIYLDRGNPMIRNCVIKNNIATYGGGGVACTYSEAEIANCIIVGNAAGECGGGIWCKSVSSTVRSCTIMGNSAKQGGGINLSIRQDSPRVINCHLNDNSATDGGGIYIEGYAGNPKIQLCTITDNAASNGGGICCKAGDPIVTSSIIWKNRAGRGPEIALTGPTETGGFRASCSVSHSDVRGGWASVYLTDGSTLNWDQGNIDADPCFTDPNSGDCHLKSQAGRWEAISQTWVRDDVTSPCVDAGNPMSPIGHEPFPNGGVINMGAYGGTAEASKSYFGEPVCETIVAGDINGDCRVDLADFAIMALHWLEDHRP
ncbi:MAG: hypothetical protein JSV03_04295 [Planctomycetota bacterium]|nr:MAG: hypothetical protein JSV03_04295 [Planctomycetota bacterium]